MPDMTVPAVLLALVLLILLGQWIMVRHAKSMRGNPAPQELIELLATDEPGRSDGLFFFESPNCGACHRMAPIVDNLAQLHSLPLYHLNVQTQQGLARILRIMGTPTTLLVHDGLIVDVIVGTISESSLRGKLSRYWPQ
ncbi:hypothetical protein A9404_02735 [Halothiobacillus diazotrophicus]|uniref:Thioredoxin domain-containing protein n=1 Tax=Halothiobacillus diazotrophicus TaxID=1860122 RepID=A0A191ZEZ9_9GAMM|nr:thioredoxin family protein [Halothiobacillus diazotrophicus]ANJ66437.1 hypothetical protein A9404_02735 [Halothiobacillus diazotrophicus]